MSYTDLDSLVSENSLGRGLRKLGGATWFNSIFGLFL